MDNIKLNEWIEEDIDIPTITPTVNKEKNRVEFKRSTTPVKQKTFYASSTPYKVVCSDHRYVPSNPGRYEFKCVKCAWSRIAPPNVFKYDPDTKILSKRADGVQV